MILKICRNFFVTISLLLLSCVKTSAMTSKNILTLTTNISTIDTNKEFYIYLNSENISSLYTITFELKFNPNIMEILYIEPGECLKNDEIEFGGNYKNIDNNTKIIKFFETFVGINSSKNIEGKCELIKIKAKLLRECKIPLQIINTNDELFIGSPNIRTIMVDNLLNKIDFENTISYIQTKEFNSDDNIKIFISDVYKNTFSRMPEEYGFNYWYNKLISYEYSVRNFILNILNEKEFIDKNLSNQEFITSMYSIIANRKPDQTGYNYWLNMLMSYQNKMDPKTAKSQIILRICNEAELSERANKLNLDF
ncbi:hypothetical protein SFBM_0048 [Candidatus Arthromitus sp. SFB-mouse-Japan]|uniref:DUF4214 domain-containing protein n=2 Tax=Candidatus Arthromitus sp. SFB-mouse TaxID=49118 RepID=UPI00021B802A|nr:DUF4214 domain-containing protein [Candidatus Arthromitus sp. SFB-mouse]EIA25335.1 hypothetical protein SFB2_016G2 [Candidatus Arthromitus sp. SFB-2]EIA26217.1 hypothetical protein SFB3_039G2 [Candidatus Arthromitus sp. SFB-3]EIA27142.1 hypothetical protein SFB4_198G2 [Candidatus Arthromitus sp. SFB-4]EIA28325.1 hypothetical protein SFB5_136G4 [Candidatus Arthromitus sp. SFB-5]EIA28501.1 Cohesin domain protein [Candidatus Arthromitus sp. SFB-co]EIA31280.1 Cohesin domain protein [Candidatus